MQEVVLRGLLAVSLVFGLGCTSSIHAVSDQGLDDRAVGLRVAQDLAKDANTAASSKRPIVVFFSSRSCPYCEIVRDLYLEPMATSENYTRKALFRVVYVGGANRIRDFRGRYTHHDEFADKEGASLTPVIKVYGPNGRELVPEIVGYSSPDFYLGFLEEAINNAHTRLQQTAAY